MGVHPISELLWY